MGLVQGPVLPRIVLASRNTFLNWHSHSSVAYYKYTAKGLLVALVE